MKTPALAELHAFLGSKEGQDAYLAWIASPVTQQVIAACRELARPRYAVTDYAVAYGESIGAHNLLDFMANPIGRAADRMQGTMPPARYGVKPTKENEHG